MPTPTPNPTLFVVLHADQPKMDVFASMTATHPLGPNDEVRVDTGGHINVVFMNKNNANVLSGKLSFASNDPDNSPFDLPEVVLHGADNNSGSDPSPIPAQSSARIPVGKAIGRYPFTISASWKGGTHHLGNDPVVVIEK